MAPTVADAARALARGELVVYPTDTLLGLAAGATRDRALARLVEAKGRSGQQPISVAVSSTEELETWADLSAAARAWTRTHLPGPYTVLVRPSARARRTFRSPVLTEGGPLGLRVPDHRVARELAQRAGPITATSANRHGQPPAHTAAEARRALGRSVAVYLPAVPAPSGQPSTLVDLTGAEPRLVARR